MTVKVSNVVTGKLDKLTDDELKFVSQLIAIILDSREATHAKEKEREEEKEKEQVDNNQKMSSEQTSAGGGYYEYKMIHGCGPYKYYRWRVGGKLKSKYCGKVR